MAGRPTDYRPEMVQKTREYLGSFEQSAEYDKDAKPREVVPTIVGLAIRLGVSRKTLYEWLKEPEGEERVDKSEFRDIVEALLSEQEISLLNRALVGDFNPNMSKLMLSKHGYAEKTETDFTSGGEKVKTITYVTPASGDHAATDA